MPFDFAPCIQKQHGQTLTVRVKMRMGRNVHPPIIGGFVGCLALLQTLWRRTFTQRGHSVFVRAGGKLERFHNLFQAGENGSRMTALRQQLIDEFDLRGFAPNLPGLCVRLLCTPTSQMSKNLEWIESEWFTRKRKWRKKSCGMRNCTFCVSGARAALSRR